MSACKRARLQTQAFQAAQQCTSQTTALTPSNWHTVLPEILHHTATFLLYSTAASLLVDVQLLHRLCSVCNGWRSAVYNESGTRHVDFWSNIGQVSVIQSQPNAAFNVAGRLCPLLVVPSVLTSLRPVRALLIRCRKLPLSASTATVVSPLLHFSRLTALHLQLSNDVSGESEIARKLAKRAIGAALAHIASRCQLISLALHCPADMQPAVDVLRRLCSSARHLSLSADALQLMAWGDGASHLPDAAWKAQSVQSYVVPRDVEPGYLSHELVVTTFAVCFPSLQLFHVESEPSAAMSALLQQLRGRLTFLRYCWSIDQLPSVVLDCASLVSLHISERQRHWREDELTVMFDHLGKWCALLTELTVITPTPSAQAPRDVVYIRSLPSRLTYLHLHLMHRPLREAPGELHVLPACNLTHLVVALSAITSVLEMSQPRALLGAFTHARLPHLAYCHVARIPRELARGRGWDEDKRALKQALGEVWCDDVDDVLRWRAD